jgi:hypothetical protein
VHSVARPDASMCSVALDAAGAAPTAEIAADFHRIDSDTFAKLFRPKSVLCGQTLELVIDKLRCAQKLRQSLTISDSDNVYNLLQFVDHNQLRSCQVFRNAPAHSLCNSKR